MNSRKILCLILAMVFAFSIAPTVFGTENSYYSFSAPIAANLEFKTYKNVAISGNVSAIDLNGEAVAFYISDAPKKGELRLMQDGSFEYTPTAGKKGKDSFSYYAVNESGNVSNKATVTVNIKQQETDVWYTDLDGDPSHYAALVLAEQDVYTGEVLGDEYFFDAGAEVTRGRFLAMCMKLCGTDTIDGVVKTGFDDDNEIPMWIKPYAAAALMTGVLDVSQTELNSEAAVTYGEAMMILDNAMNITDVYCEADDGMMQSFANLSACNIVADNAADNAEKELTMADAATLLANASEILERR